jgi:hypothetical protein
VIDMATSRPRRCSARWLDADCPKGVLAILDNPNFGDRYTVFYAEPYGEDNSYLWGRAMSAHPFHPQGIGLTLEQRTWEVAAYRYRNKHRYAKWSSLPEDCKRLVRQDLAA